ncbi:hypothetical protein HUJ04_004782 [Dendroctonus ponderosae]|nr:hypothetical protein HUJ04_004782 [Dendroctonus ponderosae]KAH1015078.1 hypothetical protein HUJ05_012856 [Dendroctonus ponderosae]
MDFDKDLTLQEWTREQPLAVLSLDSADRAVLRIAAEPYLSNCLRPVYVHYAMVRWVPAMLGYLP